MTKFPDYDYSILDVPELLNMLFYPRQDYGSPPDRPGIYNLMIPVADGVEISGRLHEFHKAAPTILFFHGNGEIVSDYDYMASDFIGLGINFLPVDYRGYGYSSGYPSVSGMMGDCHKILEYTKGWLSENGFADIIIVMGRSLGSASALELAAHDRHEIAALVIESGFASFGPILEMVRQRPGAVEPFPQNIDKIAAFTKPTLVIHAEHDHIIPFSNGRELFEAAGASDKSFLMIPGANHNDLFSRGMAEYLEALSGIISKVRKD